VSDIHPIFVLLSRHRADGRTMAGAGPAAAAAAAAATDTADARLNVVGVSMSYVCMAKTSAITRCLASAYAADPMDVEAEPEMEPEPLAGRVGRTRYYCQACGAKYRPHWGAILKITLEENDGAHTEHYFKVGLGIMDRYGFPDQTPLPTALTPNDIDALQEMDDRVIVQFFGASAGERGQERARA
jgi:hypothetical protein